MKNKIGYKLTNNFKCKSLTYEVGKEYKISSIRMCNHGFHYCEDPLDTLGYYGFNKDSILLKIQVLGIIINENDKSVTNHIKVLEVVDPFTIPNWPVIIHDNNLNHCKTSDEFNCWGQHNMTNGISTHSKDTNIDKKWNKYDKNNNIIYSKNLDGFEQWYDYNENNILIYYKNSAGYEYWQNYDSNNDLIHYKNSNGYVEWEKYDKDNNLIYYRNSKRIKWEIKII